MKVKSAKNTHNDNQSNESFEYYDVVYASRLVLDYLDIINNHLGLLYTQVGKHVIKNHSSIRDNDKEFDEVLGIVEEYLGRIMIIRDESTNHFLYKEKHDGAIFEEFEAMLYCINEVEFSLKGECKNNFERRIIDIVKGLSNIGIKKKEFESAVEELISVMSKAISRGFTIMEV